MEQKIEYYCECGRHFIVIARSKQPKKCPRCARMMYPQEDKVEQPQPQEDLLAALHQKPKGKTLDDTIEYEYTFDNQGKRMRKGTEPFTLKKFFKKLLSLLSFSGPSYR